MHFHLQCSVVYSVGLFCFFNHVLPLGRWRGGLNMILNRGPESDPAPGQHFWEIQVAKNSLKHLANLGNVGKDKNHSYFFYSKKQQTHVH